MRQKRSLSQTNTPAADRKLLHSETQVDVNEIERELLSRDHNLPAASTDCFAPPQTTTSKVQERRSKLKTALFARKRKNLAPRRPVSCDSALPRKRHSSRKNSRHPPKPTVPLKNSQNVQQVDETSAGPSGFTLAFPSSQPRDGNENAPRFRRSSSSDASSSSPPRSTFIPYHKRKRVKRLAPRIKRTNTSLIRKKRKVHSLNRRGRPDLIYCPQGSHYCVTPSPDVDISPSRTSLRNSRSTRGRRRYTAPRHKNTHCYSRGHSPPSHSRGSSKIPRSFQISRGSRHSTTSRRKYKSRAESTPSTTRLRRSESKSRSRCSDESYPSNYSDSHDVSSTPSVKKARRRSPSYGRRRRRHSQGRASVRYREGSPETSSPATRSRRRSNRMERHPKRRRLSADTTVTRRKRRRRENRSRRASRSSSSEADREQDTDVDDNDVDESEASTRKDEETSNPVPEIETSNRRYICRVM